MSSPVYIETQPSSAITFEFQPNKHILSSILFINTSSSPVLFKMRTTAPISYVVKPSFGILHPSEIIDIMITMQPAQYNKQTPSLSDRFQVSAVPCPESADQSEVTSDQNKFQFVWDSVPKSLRQASNLAVQLRFPDGHILNSSIVEKKEKEKEGRESLLFSQDLSEKRRDESFISNSNLSIIDPFPSTNFSSIASPQIANKSVKKEKFKPELKLSMIEDVKREKIKLLEQQINELTSEVQLLKLRNSEREAKNCLEGRELETMKEINGNLKQSNEKKFVKSEKQKAEKTYFFRGYQTSQMFLSALIGLIIGGRIAPYISIFFNSEVNNSF